MSFWRQDRPAYGSGEQRRPQLLTTASVIVIATIGAFAPSAAYAAQDAAVAATQTTKPTPDAAHAQTDTAGAAAQGSGGLAGTQIQDIVVTANRRETQLLKTAGSITAIGGHDIKERLVVNTSDVAVATPGLVIANNNSQTSVTIRGIGAISQSGGSEQSVGVYLDGVYQSAQSFAQLGLFDLGRLEVLKGPQGALYGRNATGGVINYVSNGPTKEFEGKVSGLYGSYNHVRNEAILSGPITDTLGVRVGGFFDREDGYWKNVFTNTREGKHKDYGGKASARWTPSDTFTVDLKGYFVQSDFDSFLFPLGSKVGPIQLAQNPIFTTAVNEVRPFKLSADFNGRGSYSRAFGGSLNLGWQLSDNVKLTSLTALTQSRLHSRSDCDGLSLPICESEFNQKQHSFQQELFAQGALFDRRLDWLVGVSYYKEYLSVAQNVFLPPAKFGQPFVLAPGFPVPPGFEIVDAIKPQHTRSVAVYTDNTFSVTDHFRANFGARSTWDRKVAQITNGFVFPGLNLPLTCDGLKLRDKWSNVTFKGGLEHDVNGGIAYASVNQGFKAGGFNITCQNAFDPEKVTSYEAGLKGRVGSNITYSGSIYYFKYSDLQVSQITFSEPRITNAGKAHGYGFEGLVNAVIGGGFSTDANISVMKAVYDKYCANDTISPGAFLTPNCVSATGTPGSNRAGQPLSRSPRFTGNLGFNYKTSISGAGEVSLRAELYHSSSVPLRPFRHDPAGTQSKYNLGNIYFTLKPEFAPKVEFQAFVKNVGDKHYLNFADGLPTTDSSYVMYGQPRTAGVQASLNF